ncbi:hypothetical protein [Rhodobacter calidifons]|uniref:hypothetical protein n=1 Tax=Rhodobacter calidifons TaxID=2715277 RepID=UPI00140AA40E|nr:hypothetical protein [Rhodobacter calidifons]
MLFLSHPDYSSITRSVSELAGLNMPNARFMRTGFVAFGTTTILAAPMRLTATPAYRRPLWCSGWR